MSRADKGKIDGVILAISNFDLNRVFTTLNLKEETGETIGSISYAVRLLVRFELVEKVGSIGRIGTYSRIATIDTQRLINASKYNKYAKTGVAQKFSDLKMGGVLSYFKPRCL